MRKTAATLGCVVASSLAASGCASILGIEEQTFEAADVSDAGGGAREPSGARRARIRGAWTRRREKLRRGPEARTPRMGWRRLRRTAGRRTRGPMHWSR